RARRVREQVALSDASTLFSIDRFDFHHHTLDQPFVAEGEFWLPESPEGRVAGTLTYESDEIRLWLTATDRTQGADKLRRYDFDTLPAWVGHIPFGFTGADSDALAVYEPFRRITTGVKSDQLQLELFSNVHSFGGGEESLRWEHEIRFAIRTPTTRPVEWHLD